MTSPDWQDRYDQRVEDARLSETRLKRDAYAAQVGSDGFRLLAALDMPGTPQPLWSGAVRGHGREFIRYRVDEDINIGASIP